MDWIDGLVVTLLFGSLVVAIILLLCRWADRE
jgi:hypothetical protein